MSSDSRPAPRRAEALDQRDRDHGPPRPRRDRSGCRSDTGLPFFDHMLAQLGTPRRPGSRASRRGATSRSTPTTPSRTPASSSARRSREALGSKAGVRRFASIAVPLDEALVEVALDLSGRPYLHYDVAARRDGAARQPAVRGAAGRGVLARLRALGGDHLAHRASPRAQPPPRPRGVASRRSAGRCATRSRIEGSGVPSTKGLL